MGGAADREGAGLRGWRRAWARLALVAFGIAAGLLSLAALELVLRAVGAGKGPPGYDPFSGFSAAVPLFERAERPDGTPVWRLSPARLHGPAAQGETPPEREFLVEKPAAGFRVFVVGGSAAAGFPYPPAYAFSAWLERRLRAQLPGLAVEVVNAAVPGYSSRRDLVAVREIAAHAPDLLVVMSGHNEWAERRYYSRLIEMDPRFFALRERLFTTRLFTILSRLRLGRSDPDAALRRFMDDEQREFEEMFAVRTRRAEGGDYATPEEVAQRDALYRLNLQEMARAARRAGARVLFVTLSQNFADWAPGASAHRPGLTAADEERWGALVREGRARAERGDCAGALAVWRRALEIDDRHAGLHFEVGRCHRARGERDPARRHFRFASDLDLVPHGAPTWFNDVLRAVAREQDLLFVDAAAALEDESDDGLVGDDLFVEFAHPNVRAHQRIAAEVAAALRRAGVPAPQAWRDAPYADPPPESLYAADPGLRVREHEAIQFACALARRPDCVREQRRRLLELRDAGPETPTGGAEAAPASPGQEGGPAGPLL